MKRAPGLWFTVVFLLACFVYAQQQEEPPEAARPPSSEAPTDGEPQPQAWEPPEPEPETVFDAAVWGMPIVSVHALREAFFRDAGAEYGDIVHWSKPADWRHQAPTPDTTSFYVYFNFNSKDGPRVLEIPAAAGAGLTGSLQDAWQVPRADIGPGGDDAGNGGKYLLLPPDYRGAVPGGYFLVRFPTYNGYARLRILPEDTSEAAGQRALALLKQLRLYPLAEAVNPPQQKYIDMSGKLFDGIVRFDERFFEALARMVDEEPALPRDATMLADLKTLGIIQGQPFEPSVATRQLFAAAAQEVHADFMRRAPAEGQQYYAERHWRVVGAGGAKTGFTYESDGRLDEAARGLAHFLGAAPPGGANGLFHLTAFVDGAGQPLSGRRAYRLHIPAEAPAAQFWSVAVYAAETASFFRDSPVISISSRDPTLQQNDDGTVDIYFGPQPPAGNESNWIYTAPAQGWFAIFRFHGPEQPLLDKTWMLPDIHPVR